MVERERKCQPAGWGIFIVSSLFFIAAGFLVSFPGGDPVGFLGSLLFFIACLAFLYPLDRRARPALSRGLIFRLLPYMIRRLANEYELTGQRTSHV